MPGRNQANLVALLVLWFGAAPGVARAQQVALSHTNWEMHSSGVVRVSNAGTTHGDPALYRYAPAIPPPGHDWAPLVGGESDPRNPLDINYLGPHDDYSSGLQSCLTELEFTCFQTFVTLPAGFLVRQATVTLGPLDDGARVLVYNSAHMTGAIPEEGYLLIGDSKIVDVAGLLKAGEVNRVVVQHMDDCGGQSWLGTVSLEVKGDGASGTSRPTWGRLKSMYR